VGGPQSTARHDLVLVLYARAQRVHVPGQPLVAADDELFDAAWALPVAVKLAGGGGQGSLVDRDMGASRSSCGGHPSHR